MTNKKRRTNVFSVYLIKTFVLFFSLCRVVCSLVCVLCVCGSLREIYQQFKTMYVDQMTLCKSNRFAAQG